MFICPRRKAEVSLIWRNLKRVCLDGGKSGLGANGARKAIPKGKPFRVESYFKWVAWMNSGKRLSGENTLLQGRSDCKQQSLQIQRPRATRHLRDRCPRHRRDHHATVQKPSWGLVKAPKSPVKVGYSEWKAIPSGSLGEGG